MTHRTATHFVLFLAFATMGPASGATLSPPEGLGIDEPRKSGSEWVEWANEHARNSRRVEDLEEPFRSNVREFLKALEDAGARVRIASTRRDPKRAYLFHWSWKIALGKAEPSKATPMEGVPIEWDHGDLAASKAGAQSMVDGFGLAVPPASTVAPSLTSNHIRGMAIDMNISWDGDLKVKTKEGTLVSVPFIKDVNANTRLHEVGATYGVMKLTTDAPHWSHNGR